MGEEPAAAGPTEDVDRGDLGAGLKQGLGGEGVGGTLVLGGSKAPWLLT